MKNKIIYIIVSLLQIFCSIYLFLIRKIYVSQIIESYKKISLENPSVGMYQKFYEYFSEHGEMFFIFILTVTIILNLFLIYKLIKSDDINYKLIIIFSLICALINESIYLMLLSLTNFIIVIIDKRKNKKSSKIKKEANETIVPILKRHPSSLRLKFLAIVGILLYFTLPYILRYLPLGYITLNIILDIIMILVCVLIFRHELLRDIKVLLENFQSYIKFLTNKYFLALGIYFLISIISLLIKGEVVVSENQQTLQMLPELFVVISAIVYAPIVEEFIFRGAIRRLIASDKLYIIVSALSFGLLHTLGEATLFDVIVLSLPYATLGGFFAYIYTKTENITASMICHFLHNAIACIMLILY